MLLRLLLVFSFLVCQLPVRAQSSLEAVRDSLIRVAKAIHQERVLLRVDCGSLFRWKNGWGWGGTARLGIEGKISRNWTVLGEWSSRYVALPKDGLLPMIQSESGGMHISLAPRFYRRLLEGHEPVHTASGFSAVYWTLEISTLLLPSSQHPGLSNQFLSDNLALSPTLGFQQRLWTFGYLDASLGLGCQYLHPDSSLPPRWPLKPGWTFLPSAQVQVGFGLGM